MLYMYIHRGFPDSSVDKESAWNAGDSRSIPGSGRSSGEGIGYHSSILGLPLCLRWWRIHLQCGRPRFWSLGWEDPLERGKATHSNIWAYGKITAIAPQLWRTKRWGKGQFSSVTQSCPTFCKPMDCSMPCPPVHHRLPEFTQPQIYWVGDAIQPSHPLSSPSPPANLS